MINSFFDLIECLHSPFWDVFIVYWIAVLLGSLLQYFFKEVRTRASKTFFHSLTFIVVFIFFYLWWGSFPLDMGSICIDELKFNQSFWVRKVPFIIDWISYTTAVLFLFAALRDVVKVALGTTND